MFTGLIEEIGKVNDISINETSARIEIKANKVLENIQLGDSISTNGVCLTVVDFDMDTFVVDVMPETMRKSNLYKLKSGSKVNLERALKIGDRLGGHIVSGHVDGIGQIQEITEEDNAIWVTITTSKEILKYVVEKGSITIDGISLTVAYIDEKIFKVSIIPLTQDETTLTRKVIGEVVNIECDVLGKYVEKMLMYRNIEQNKSSSIDLNFLKDNGFI